MANIESVFKSESIKIEPAAPGSQLGFSGSDRARRAATAVQMHRYSGAPLFGWNREKKSAPKSV